MRWEGFFLGSSVYVAFFKHDQYPLRLGSLSHSLLFSCLHCTGVLVKDSGSLRRQAFPEAGGQPGAGEITGQMGLDLPWRLRPRLGARSVAGDSASGGLRGPRQWGKDERLLCGSKAGAFPSLGLCVFVCKRKGQLLVLV